MIYTNAAGNKYEISEIQWFASDITLHRRDGDTLLLDEGQFAHYIDTDLPETNTWIISESIPTGEYEGISFTFGIKGEKNKPYMFTDPPESDMIWPINLGGDQGGYHYMKLNGFFVNEEGVRQPFNFHLGVGQETDSQGNITGFIQNWRLIELKKAAFEVEKNEKILVKIVMNVENWFRNPNLYDHNTHGGKIMQNQEAMQAGVENGQSDVFTIGSIEKVTSFEAKESLK